MDRRVRRKLLVGACLLAGGLVVVGFLRLGRPDDLAFLRSFGPSRAFPVGQAITRDVVGNEVPVMGSSLEVLKFPAATSENAFNSLLDYCKATPGFADEGTSASIYVLCRFSNGATGETITFNPIGSPNDRDRLIVVVSRNEPWTAQVIRRMTAWLSF